MGANLARNAARNGAKVFVYNRTQEKTDEFMKAYGEEGDFVACKTIKEVKGRPILLMVKAGGAVDAVMEELGTDDIVIDGGNSHYSDTERRAAAHPRFIGMGVSGGEEGALMGPSMMPGGDREAWDSVEPLFTAMAAQVESSKLKVPSSEGKCVAYIGPGGAGHFVKMVHNGIEYAIMQLIAESYDILKSEGKKTNEELAEIFKSWNEGEDLNSYLMEITGKIFLKKEKGHLIDVIKDAAGQKGTGKWTTEAAMTFGVPVPTINAAVDARILSGSDHLRAAGKEFPESIEQPYEKSEKLVSRVRGALELASICVYSQGFDLMNVASKKKGWNLDHSEIARIWSGGCIIRSSFLAKRAKMKKDEVVALFGGEKQLDWRRVISIAQGRGIPVPAMSSALAYFDAMRRDRLPQNLIQAQRDFFGAHTFERIDKEGVFHADWK